MLFRNFIAALALACSLPFAANAQLVRSTPAFPSELDSIVVTYDATQGSAGLLNQTGDLYVHTGVITTLSTGASDWKYVKAGWTTNTTACKLVRDAVNPNLYRFTIRPDVRSFYGVTNATESATQLAMVFRNATSTLTGKTSTGGDIFLPLYAPGSVLQTNFLTPAGDFGVYALNGTVPLQANASLSADLKFIVDGAVVATQANATQLQYNLNVTTGGDHLVAFVAATATQQDTAFYHYTVPNSLVQDAPAGTKNGANYISPTNIRLKLTAPLKDNVYVIGSFNDWKASAAYQLKKSNDNTYYWIDLTLPQGKHTYQYYVDGSLKIADPLSEVVLNQWDDSYIPTANYPNRPAFPANGKATGNVSLLETDLPNFVWTSAANYTRPKNTDLVIYELLIRDFVAAQNFKAVKDSLDYLQRLGVNCIELMPVSEFEGNLSWGYNVSLHGALDKYYGTRTAFKQLVDECHRRNIAVVMDIAFNHAFSQCPLTQLYWDAANSRPAANSPYFNVTAKHDFNVGYDFNHSTPYTQDYVVQVCKRWMADFKIDGFRFDLSKGFTQNNTLGNVGAWGGYDQSRIDLLKYYYDQYRTVDPSMICILEHFADNSEETVLANYGMLPWGNGTHDYNEVSMGWGADIAWATSYKARNWQTANLVTFIESHDEERTNYKNITYGATNTATGYNVKTLATALKRQEMIAALFFSVPGPKMVYEFGELGYDKSITLCTNGTLSVNCRLDQKPLLWSYYADQNRKHLFDVYSRLIALKKELAAFESTNFTLNTNTNSKFIKLNDPTMNVVTVANTATINGTVTPNFPSTGMWYDAITGDSLNVTNTAVALNLVAGEYHVYTSQKVMVATENTAEIATKHFLTMFPNPTAQETTIAYSLPENSVVEVSVFNMYGQKITTISRETKPAGDYYETWNTAEVASGTYLVRLSVNGATETKKVVKM